MIESTYLIAYNILYIPSTVFPTVFKPKMPYYGLATRAQAVVIKALGTPLKLITKITRISGKHIGNLVKKVVENSWNANWVLLNNYLKDKPHKGRTKKITPNIK